MAVALVIGTVELAGLVADRLGAQGSFWVWLEHIDISALQDDDRTLLLSATAA